MLGFGGSFLKIRCAYIKLVPINELKPHPDNPNDHSLEQIERLAKIIKYQGWRRPITVSNRSGFISAGHGRLEAAKFNEWTEVPVDFQDYDSEEQEYADVTADNAIALWAELNLSKINSKIIELGPELDVDMLGLKGFTLDPSEKNKDGDDQERAKLTDKFIVPPFSILDTRQGYWQERKAQWLAMGIESEIGRESASPPGGAPMPMDRGYTLGAIPPNEQSILKRTGKYK